MKVILNGCYGTLSISKKAIDEYKLQTGVELKSECYDHRDDPVLVGIVEKLGREDDDLCANLYIAEIPDGYDYIIEPYAEYESIRLRVNEEHLRKLIASGDADTIVSYVLGAR